MKKILLWLGSGLSVSRAPEIAWHLRRGGFSVFVLPDCGNVAAILSAGAEVAPSSLAADLVVLLGADEEALPAFVAGLPVLSLWPQAEGEFSGLRRGDRACPFGFPDGAEVVRYVRFLLAPKPLAGKTFLLTAGPTVEDLDPVRFLSNRSSGKMGVALASEAAQRGALVKFIHGPLQVAVPSLPGIECFPVRGALEMFERVMAEVADCEVAVLCAAVADFTPAKTAEHKIKKADGGMVLELARTKDILATLGALEKRPLLVGFAAESRELARYAQDKLERKNCDFLCANNIAEAGSGFAVDTNRVTIYRRDGEPVRLPQLSKSDVAGRILDELQKRL